MTHRNTPTEVHYATPSGALSVDLEDGEPYVIVRGAAALSAAEARETAAQLTRAANRIEHGPQRTVGT